MWAYLGVCVCAYAGVGVGVCVCVCYSYSLQTFPSIPPLPPAGLCCEEGGVVSAYGSDYPNLDYCTLIDLCLSCARWNYLTLLVCCFIAMIMRAVFLWLCKPATRALVSVSSLK